MVGVRKRAAQTREPRLWVRRMVLFASSDQRDTPIREIPFHRGLNIVWGVELPDEAGRDKAHPVRLSGHSVGKTTLCRLLRYCLGEKSFGNRWAVNRIQNRFPKGYVGCEIIIEGRTWAVLKPIGTSGKSKAGEGETAESLFDLDSDRNRYQEFMAKLGNSMMDGLPGVIPPEGGKPYEWLHLLAWMTRDQEARFQSLHEWRSLRSESESPRFQKPKEHALHLMRMVLGLLRDAEIQTLGELERCAKEANACESTMQRLRQEPGFRFREQDRRLRELLHIGPHEELNIAENDVTSQVAVRRAELEARIESIRQDLAKINRSIARLRYYLAAHVEEQRGFESAMEATTEGMEPVPDEGEEDPLIEEIRQRWGKECRFAGILYGECEYVKNRMPKPGKVIDVRAEREEERVVGEMKRRQAGMDQMQDEAAKDAVLLERLRERLRKDQQKRDDNSRELAGVLGELERLESAVREYRTALDLYEGRTPNTELLRESERLAELTSKRESLRQKLDEERKGNEENVRTLHKTYDTLVKRVLSDTYSGEVELEKGELTFGIREETGMSGEAVETLALALADVTSVLASCKGYGFHPRFLIHDSPREADLDRHIYNRYLEEMGNLTAELGGPMEAPFQYIVTTTSRPPKAVENAIVLQLEGYPESRLLFGCQLKNPPLKLQRDFFEQDAHLQ